MSWLARLMYGALVWKERQRARRAGYSARELRRESEPSETGRRGETLAYWYLRQAGYTIVARNRRSRPGAEELDMVGWDGPVLAFVEVKTRTSSEAGPPEAGVSAGQQKRIVRAAKQYLRRLKRRPVSYRFDIVSVSWEAAAGLQVRLIRDAFKA